MWLSSRIASVYSGLKLTGSQWTDQYPLQAGGLIDCLQPYYRWYSSWMLPVLRCPIHEWVQCTCVVLCLCRSSRWGQRHYILGCQFLYMYIGLNCLPSVLWRCWLGSRKGIRPVKTEWCGAGMVVCLERYADLHMAQLLPLPLTVSCFSKIQIGLPFWYWLTRVVAEKGPLNVCVCVHRPMFVAVYVCTYMRSLVNILQLPCCQLQFCPLHFLILHQSAVLISKTVWFRNAFYIKWEVQLQWNFVLIYSVPCQMTSFILGMGLVISTALTSSPGYIVIRMTFAKIC